MTTAASSDWLSRILKKNLKQKLDIVKYFVHIFLQSFIDLVLICVTTSRNSD